MNQTIPATAFVLAGGQSQRFPGDKALQDWFGKPLIQHVVESLSNSFETLIVVAQSGQDYQDILSVPIVSDLIPNSGPLGGIHAALSTSSTHWNFITACDMPFLNEKVIQTLWMHHNDDVAAVIPEVDGRLIPTLGFYHRQALASLEADLKHGRLAVYRWLKSMPIKIVSGDELKVVDPHLQSVINVNTLEDRERALKFLD